jgi:hypothetical protein
VVYYPDSTSHIAIGLTGLGKEKNIYISFFPGNEKSIAGFRLHELNHDRFKENHQNRAATVVILPTEESCGYGLSENAIYHWWKNEFHPGRESFNWFTNNCSSIVYRALCVGQIHSHTLNKTSLEKDFWLCSPGKILSYAIDLADAMYADKTIEGDLFLKFSELKTICELGKLKNPYCQVLALYTRISQFNTDNYSLILNKPFCDMIKNVLVEFSNKLADSSGTDCEQLRLLASLNSDEFSTVNPDLFFEKLKNLMEHILAFDNSKVLAKHGIKEGPEFIRSQLLQHALQVLQTTIANQLLTPMSAYIDQFVPHVFQQRANIIKALDGFAENLDANNNPHKKYVQKSEPIPQEFRNISFGRVM